MKRIIYLIIYDLIFGLSLQGQCPPQDLIIQSQVDLDNFINMYPLCTQISGNINLDGTDVTNLDALSNIDVVTGRISILNNENLENINGVSQLAKAGSLLILNNDALENIIGFDNTDSIANATIAGNDVLENITGFENLIYADSLRILGNDALSSIPSFSKLKNVGTLIIDDNDSLSLVTGFEELEEINGSCRLRGPSLSTLVGFNKVQKTASLSISGIFDSIYCFNKLDTALSIIVRGVDQISVVNIFQEVKYIDNTLFIVDYNGGELNGFKKYNFSDGSSQFLLISLSNFENLDFLSNLKTATGFKPKIKLTENPNLKDISGLDGLNPADIDRLEITDNPMLSTCHSDLICGILEQDDVAELDIEIEDNAPGCNSPEEILVLCAEKENEPDSTDMCPMTPLPGMQINRVDVDHYDIIYTYGSKRMFIEAVNYTSVSVMIDHFLMEKYLLFDTDTFELEQLCTVAEQLSKGQTYERPPAPADTYEKYMYDNIVSEITDCQDFALFISDKECVKF